MPEDRDAQEAREEPIADIISGAADVGLLCPGRRPCGCKDALADLSRAERARAASEPALNRDDGDDDLAAAARTWLERQVRERPSRGYFRALGAWLSQSPRHRQAFSDELERLVLDPLKALRRPPGGGGG